MVRIFGSSWDAGAKIQINDNTPWDILRASLNWNIWVQKCEEELNGHPFSLGKVLFYWWKTVIHVGAEVWRRIFRHKRSQDKITELTTLFNTVWTQQGVFATPGNTPYWKSTVLEMASTIRLSSTRPSTSCPSNAIKAKANDLIG
uniref:Uncharacterized protein n=1 Tax=Physcomitrium patens TaxID=3218 RepID=A0A2K1L0L9_PHYPA|nr:hypothetical protein PHYPA_002362 [Physcomitrium patens]